MIQLTEQGQGRITYRSVEEIATWGVWALHLMDEHSGWLGITHIPTGLSIIQYYAPPDDMLRLLYALPAEPVGLASHPPEIPDQAAAMADHHKQTPAGKEIKHIVYSWFAVYK